MTDPEIEFIRCGRDFTFLYRKNGDLLAWGENSGGQLGLKDFETRKKPTLVVNDREIRALSCGYAHTAMHKKNGEVYVFGRNVAGELGLNDMNDRNEPILLLTDKTISIMLTGNRKATWTPEHHSHFPSAFQNAIHTFVLALKRIRSSSGIRLPKFILFEIIKKTI